MHISNKNSPKNLGGGAICRGILPKKLISAMLMLALLCSSLAIPTEFHLTASADDTTTWSNCSGEGNNKTYTYADFTPFDPDKEGNGTGTESNPYTINTAAQLAALAILVNNTGTGSVKGINNSSATCSNFQNTFIELNTDIDLGEHQWVPIGDNNKPFKGNFDGCGYTISNMHIGGNPSEGGTAANYKYAGLFGYVQADSDVTIQNVNIGENSWVYIKNDSDDASAGGICAKADAFAYDAAKITISNCSNSATVSSSSYAGGICAYAFVDDDGTITISNCSNSGSITATSTRGPVSAGGICAYADTASSGGTITISNCSNSGQVSSSSSYYTLYFFSASAGGICGQAAYASASASTITISNCSNNGSVTATSTRGPVSAGGICAGASSYATINNCSNSGQVSSYSSYSDSSSYAGGICAKADATISNCYYLKGCVGTTDDEGRFTSSETQLGIGNKSKDDQTGTTALPAEQMKAAAKSSGDTWTSITVTYTDSNNTTTEVTSGNIALVDALNAWVRENNADNDRAFTAVKWKTANNNSIYPVLMIFSYVSFQTTLGYEIGGHYFLKSYVDPDKKTLKNTKTIDITYKHVMSIMSTNGKKLTLNIKTTQYTLDGRTLSKNETDNQHIVEVVDDGVLYVGVFDPSHKVKIQAKEKNSKGENFYRWVGNVDNDPEFEVLSYNNTYYFFARSDRTIIAEYGNGDSTASSKKVATNIESVEKVEEGGTTYFKVVSMSSVPKDYTITYAGLLAYNGESLPKNFKVVNCTKNGESSVGYHRGYDSEKNNAQYTWTKGIDGSQKTWYVRAYLNYKDENEEQHDELGEIFKIELNNDSNEIEWTSVPEATEGGQTEQ